MDDIPPDIQNDALLDGASYAERIEYFRKKSEVFYAQSDTFLLTGHNYSIKVSHDALSLKQGSTRGESTEPTLLYRGVHNVKQIVFLSTSGSISIAALRWCKSQTISLLMIDELGDLLYSIFPESSSSVKLRRLQYQAVDKSGIIARELIRRKTAAQIDMLRTLPERERVGETITELVGKRIVFCDGLGRVLISSTCRLLEDGLAELSHMSKIGTIQALEGRLATRYWDAFIGLPIKWNPKDEKIVPPHWKEVTERGSTLSSGNTARRATNPFHTALNYMYTVTEHQLLGAIHVNGLDPACGFLHADSDSRLSLVFDLIEPLRAVVDARVYSFFKRETFSRGDFSTATDGRVMFNPELLRFLVASCKLDDSISGGIVSWFKEYLLEVM
jgi:CRISPR-associated protein Cas1